MNREVEHLFISSFVVGFVICNILGLIPPMTELVNETKYIVFIVFSLILGLISGKIFTSTYINKICDMLKIRATVSHYIWDDLCDNKHPMYIITSINGVKHEGYVHFMEGLTNSPIVSLASYIAGDEDMSMSENEVIVLDLSNADWIKVRYYNESYMCNDIKELKNNRI